MQVGSTKQPSTKHQTSAELRASLQTAAHDSPPPPNPRRRRLSATYRATLPPAAAAPCCSLPVESPRPTSLIPTRTPTNPQSHNPKTSRPMAQQPSQGSKHPLPAALNPRSPPSTKDPVRSPTSPHHGTHRQSFSETLRAVPPSPRTPHRQPSLTQQAVFDLLNNPPIGKSEDQSRFKGRDWHEIQVGEIVDEGEVRFVGFETSDEDATNVCAYFFFSIPFQSPNLSPAKKFSI